MNRILRMFRLNPRRPAVSAVWTSQNCCSDITSKTRRTHRMELSRRLHSITAVRRTWRIQSFYRDMAHRRITRRNLPVLPQEKVLRWHDSNAAAVWTRIERFVHRCCQNTRQDLVSHWTETRLSERVVTATTVASTVSIRT